MENYDEILKKILVDPEYRENIEWGEARSGHPEGKVVYHIAELLNNLIFIEKEIPAEMLVKLKILIHVHDSFKAKSVRGVAIEHPKSHASLAKKFLSKYTHDWNLLNIVQYHDEPYALWRQVQKRGSYDQERWDSLRQKIGDWDLFRIFCMIDGITIGKEPESTMWFLEATQHENYIDHYDMMDALLNRKYHFFQI